MAFDLQAVKYAITLHFCWQYLLLLFKSENQHQFIAMTSRKYWGEISQPDQEMIPDVSAEIELAMQKSCLDEFFGEEKEECEKFDQVL